MHIKPTLQTYRRFSSTLLIFRLLLGLSRLHVLKCLWPGNHSPCTLSHKIMFFSIWSNSCEIHPWSISVVNICFRHNCFSMSRHNGSFWTFSTNRRSLQYIKWTLIMALTITSVSFKTYFTCFLLLFISSGLRIWGYELLRFHSFRTHNRKLDITSLSELSKQLSWKVLNRSGVMRFY